MLSPEVFSTQFIPQTERPIIDDSDSHAFPKAGIVFTPEMTHTNMIIMGAHDLHHRDHEQVVAVVNNALDRQTKASLQETGKMIPPYAVERGKQLREGLDTFMQATARAELTPEAQELVQRYKEADMNAADENERIIQRLGTRPRRYKSDIDGTVTLHPDKYLEELLPGSSIGEAILKQHGRESFPEAFAATWNHGIAHIPNTYTEAGKQVELRPGVNDAITYFTDRGDSFDFLSANFTAFAEGVRHQIPAAADANIGAVTPDNLSATEKGHVLIQDAIAHPDTTLVYIGDGGSDLPTIEAAEYVGMYWALKGSTFAHQLEEHGIAHRTYETFDDIKNAMQKIDQQTAILAQKELQSV